jgi:ParB family chromosome partitioning protein
MNKRRSLGRGLDALLSSARPAPPPPAATADPAAAPKPAESGLREVPVELLRRGKYQPRLDMREESLAELAESIKAQGVVQPIVVRPLPNVTGGETEYEIVAGERRWRAAQMAGMQEIPALVREVPDESALAMSLIENIQRENLNPMEEAAGLQRLADEFRMTHEQVADAVGRSRSATTNLLRLLRLAKPVQELVMEGALEMGHARALLSLEGARQIEAAHRIAARGLSVREAEALAGSLQKGQGTRRKPRVDRDLSRLEDEVSGRLGTTVEIRPGAKGSGKIVVHYSGLDHLDQLLKKLR